MRRGCHRLKSEILTSTQRVFEVFDPLLDGFLPFEVEEREEAGFFEPFRVFFLERGEEIRFTLALAFTLVFGPRVSESTRAKSALDSLINESSHVSISSSSPNAFEIRELLFCSTALGGVATSSLMISSIASTAFSLLRFGVEATREAKNF
jgi:hypothetical protein